MNKSTVAYDNVFLTEDSLLNGLRRSFKEDHGM